MNIKDKIVISLELIGLAVLAIFCLGCVAGIFILCTCGWDYKTGQDTGYISAVDKMWATNDREIYLRRRPLDSTGMVQAEKDETIYCTTEEHQDIIEKAYKAMETGKRVVLVYDTPREFGWRKIGGCNSAPITDIKFIEE